MTVRLVVPEVRVCHAMTKKGKPCQRKAEEPRARCRQHALGLAILAHEAEQAA